MKQNESPNDALSPRIPVYIYTEDGSRRKLYRHASTTPPKRRKSAPKGTPTHSECTLPGSPDTHITDLSPVRPTHITDLPSERSIHIADVSFGQPILGSSPRRTHKDARQPRPRLAQVTKPYPNLNKPLPKRVLKLRRPESGFGSHHGLGIMIGNTPPGDQRTLLPTHQRVERSSNIAQRIEERIWQYNSSGNMCKRWLLEIISWWLSALCMAAIVGVLIYYRDKTLPRWPGGLTLNAFIATLSRISGAALILPVSEALGQLKWSWFQKDSKEMWDFEIFDNASRGPWGALLLLVRTKGRALAAVGALVMLFSLALDPVFQQVVDFPERWALNGKSSIPRVVKYAPYVGVDIKNGRPTAQQDQAIQVVAETFFFGNGTQPMPFGNGTRADVPLSCPSSNCTWPLYETLGVCSSCTPVPELLTWGCYNASLDWISTQAGFNANTTYGEACGYFLNATSSNPVFMSGYSVNSNGTPGEALLTRILPLVTNPTRHQLYAGSIHYKHILNPIVDALIVGADEGPESVYHDRRPSAHECVISWCVKTVKSSYWLATYKEEIIETFINTTSGSFPWSEVKQFDKSSGLNGTETFYLQNITIEAPLNGQNSSVFGVSNETAFTTIFTFDDIFPSFVTVANSTAEMFLRYKVANRGPLLRSLVTNPWTHPNNVPNHIERLATALTNAIRSSSSKEMISGLAFDKENFVSVRWQWLTLPLGLLLTSMFFLIATVIKTTKERKHIDVRKNSALAMLLFGLPDRHQHRLISRTFCGSPRTKAKNVKIQLLSRGWRVSENVCSPVTTALSATTRNPPPPGWI